MVIAKETVPPTKNSYPLIVSYRGKETIKKLLKAGKYNYWTSRDITDSHFPQNRGGDEAVTLEVLRFAREVSCKGAERELKKRGYRPANPAELLAFGAKYPDEQKKHPILASGQLWRYKGKLHIVALGALFTDRDAYVLPADGRWSEAFCFAAIRKVT